MKKILYTQRVEIVPAYGERRDCADQRLVEFLSACGFLPIAAPNVPAIAESLAEGVLPEGILFTGGNSLAAYGGDAPERDETEARLLAWARRRGCPVFGICRGMQFLFHQYGGTLSPLDGHVAVRHGVRGAWRQGLVNSYHTLSAVFDGEAEKVWKKTAVAEDGAIEAMVHRFEPVAAVMWHPERESGFCREDVELMKSFFG